MGFLQKIGPHLDTFVSKGEKYTTFMEKGGTEMTSSFQ